MIGIWIAGEDQLRFFSQIYGLDNARLYVAREMHEHDQEVSWHPPSASMLLSNHELATQAGGVVRRTGVTPVVISIYLNRDALS